MRDTTNFIDVIDLGVDSQLNASGVLDEVSLSGVSSTSNQDIQGNTISNAGQPNEQREVTISRYQEKTDKVNEMSNDIKQQQNEQSNPDFYNSVRNKSGLVSINEVDNAARILMDVPIGSLDSCTRESNQNESTYSW